MIQIRLFALFVVSLTLALAWPQADAARAADKCGQLLDNYKVKVTKGDVSCTNARRVMRQFADNIADGECQQTPECSDASPPGWTCKNLRDKPGEYPGPVLKCARDRDGATVLVVYTGPPITGE